MNKKIFQHFFWGILFCLFLFGFLPAGSEAAVSGQIVVTDVLNFENRSGGSLELTARYRTDPVAQPTIGLVLRLHFDSSKLQWQGFGDILPTALVGGPQIHDDVQNLDGDPATDRVILFSWIEWAAGRWLAGVDATNLFTVHFTLIQALTEPTAVRFTTVLNPGNTTAFSVVKGIPSDQETIEENPLLTVATGLGHNPILARRGEEKDPDDDFQAGVSNVSKRASKNTSHGVVGRRPVRSEFEPGSQKAALLGDPSMDHTRLSKGFSTDSKDTPDRTSDHDPPDTRASRDGDNGFLLPAPHFRKGRNGKGDDDGKRSAGNRHEMAGPSPGAEHGGSDSPVADRRIDGFVEGLAAGHTVLISAHSEQTDESVQVELTGNGERMDFSLVGLAAVAKYRLQWTSADHPAGYWDGRLHGPASGSAKAADAKPLDLKKGSVDGVGILLSRGGSITVQVRGSPAGDGPETEDLEAFAFSDSSGGAADGTFESTADDQRITLANLVAADDYRLHVTSTTGAHRSGYFTAEGTLNGDVAAAVPLTVRAGRDLPLSLTLQKGRNIHGTLYGLTDGTTALIRIWSKTTGENRLITLTGNGEALPYHLNGLTPGDDYRLCVEADGLTGGCYSRFAPMENSYDRASRLDLSQADRTGIDLLLTEGRSISGMVYWASVSGVEVTVEVESETTSFRSKTVVEKHCHYRLDGLPEGPDYVVTLRAPGYPSQPAKTVDLSLVDAEGVHFILPGGGRIEGDATGLEPREGITIVIVSAEAGVTRKAGFTADDNGSLHYLLAALPAATDYRVRLTTNRETLEYDTESMDGGGVVVADDEVVSGIDFNLESGR